MEKQTKNIITREWIEKELRFYNTADIRSTLVVCGALSLIFVPLTFGAVYGIFLLSVNILLKLLFSLLTGAITSAPIWMNLLTLRGAFAERKMLQHGDFDIVTREVLYKSEKPYRRHIEEFLHFAGFKGIMVGHTTFQLASKGDEFYIVHYKTKNAISLLYSVKLYEYQ